MEIRLNKALADAGVCSRRKADELVFSGRVRVNGRLADSPGLRIDPQQVRLEVDGQEIALRDSRHQSCVLMLHKPIEVLCSVRDPEGRRTVMDFVPPRWQDRRLYPVGRLDYFSEGLILLSDDGELANRLMHPRWHLPRVYLVRVRLPYDWDWQDLDRACEIMAEGMTLAEGDRLAPVGVRIVSEAENSALLRLTLDQGLNRQIRRMCRDLGLVILQLKRVAQGPLLLGDLPPGEIRELSVEEMDQLRSITGLAPSI